MSEHIPQAILRVNESDFRAADVPGQWDVQIYEDQITGINNRFGSRHAGRVLIASLTSLAVGFGAGVTWEKQDQHRVTAASDQTEIKTPHDVPTVTATITVRPKPSIAPTVTPPKPGLQEQKIIAGMSANYQGFTAKQVKAMESCGNNTDRVLLTFDDYSTPAHIDAITSVLTKNNIGAIFFPFTKAKTYSPEEVTSLRRQGFWVGNHSTTHPDMHKLDDEQIKIEIENGVDSNLFRPPYGATYVDKDQKNKILFDERVGQIAAQKEAGLGKRICMWTVDTKDWSQRSPTDTRRRSAAQITQTVKDEVRPGSVVLMHMVDGYNTLAALPGIIEAVHAKGLKFCVKSSAATTANIPSSLPCEK